MTRLARALVFAALTLTAADARADVAPDPAEKKGCSLAAEAPPLALALAALGLLRRRRP